MNLQNGKEINFKKLTHNISNNSKSHFIQSEENEILLSSDNKLLKYNYSTSFLTAKFKVSSTKKIEKFITKDDKKAICLLRSASNDSTTEFVEFDFESKAITKTFEFNGDENEKVQNFSYSGKIDTFLLITNLGRILYVQEKEKNFVLLKKKSIFDSVEQAKVAAKSKTNKKQILFTEISHDGKIAIFPFENKLILHNLINSESITIEFIKNLSCGAFISEDKAVISDSAGKLHFISNLNQKFSIATRHWHAHRVNALEVDQNGDYLYSAGKEGVIVIWNLKSEEKSFLPRLNSEIFNLKISHNSQYLTAVCADNSVKTIDLFNFQVINEFSGLSLNSTADERNIKQFHIKSENYLLFFNEATGKIQIFNVNSGKILSSSYVFNKNFVSSTEREEINCRKLKHVEIDVMNFEYLVTYEEIADEKDPNFLISYLKFWKFQSANFKRDFSIELICSAENPHDNEKITQIEISGGKCVTYSKSHFKLWEISEVASQNNTPPSFVCSFMGAYKKETCKSVTGIFKAKERCIYAVHNSKYLIKWDLNIRKISSIFVLNNKGVDQVDSSPVKLVTCGEESDRLFIYNNRNVSCFSTIDWEIVFEEKFEKFTVRNFSSLKGKIYLTLSKNFSKDEYLIYTINEKSENKFQPESCHYLRKKNLIYLNIWKNINSLVLVNSNFDVIITKKTGLLGTKQMKRSREEEILNEDDEEEMKVDLFHNKNKKRLEKI